MDTARYVGASGRIVPPAHDGRRIRGSVSRSIADAMPTRLLITADDG